MSDRTAPPAWQPAWQPASRPVPRQPQPAPGQGPGPAVPPVVPPRGPSLQPRPKGAAPRSRLRKPVEDWQQAGLRVLALTSKNQAQIQQAAGVQATQAALFQPGGTGGHAQAAVLASTHPDPRFDAYTQAMAALEADAAKPAVLRAQVKATAEDYVANKAPSMFGTRLNVQRELACKRALSDLAMFETAEEIGTLGPPPWDTGVAMKFASLKTAMDFESLPVGGQTASLNGAQTATTTLWINSAGPGGTTKTSIFKPQLAEEINGYPPGGEPVREAVTGRAADLLNGLGFSIPMPETHVIAVNRSRMPEDAGKALADKAMQQDGPLIGSLQNFSAAACDMKAQTRGRQADVPARAIQQLAVMDIITLNTDRHGGNLLSTNGQPPVVVPIDHGLAFPPASVISTLPERMAARHNALLAFPGAHEPFDAETLASIEKLDPKTFTGILREESAALSAAHPALAGTLGEDSLDATARSIRFLKLAAPRLTPAATQVALGRHAARLFDPKLAEEAFADLAEEVIAATEADQSGIAEFFQMPVEQQQMVANTLDKNGWNNELGGGRYVKVAGMMGGNLTLAMKLYHSDTRKLPPMSEPADAPKKATVERAIADIKREFPDTYTYDDQIKSQTYTAYQRFKSSGKTAEQITLAAAAMGVDDYDVQSAKGNVIKLMQLEASVREFSAAAAIAPDTRIRKVLQDQLAYVETLVPLLPANADPDIVNSVARARNAVGLAKASDGLLNDLVGLLRTNADLAYDLIRARLIAVIRALQAAGSLKPKQASGLEGDVQEGNLVSVMADLVKVDPNLAGL